MHCVAQKLVLDAGTWSVFPGRGQAVVHHRGFLYVVGGKRFDFARRTSVVLRAEMRQSMLNLFLKPPVV